MNGLKLCHSHQITLKLRIIICSYCYVGKSQNYLLSLHFASVKLLCFSLVTVAYSLRGVDVFLMDIHRIVEE